MGCFGFFQFLFTGDSKGTSGEIVQDRKITQNVILFKKAISVLSSLLNIFTFRAIFFVCFSHIPWIINSYLILNCPSWGCQLAQINKALSEENKTETTGRFARGMKKISIRWVFSQVLTVKWKDLSLSLSPFSSSFFPPPSFSLLFFPLFYLSSSVCGMIKKIRKGLLFSHDQFPLAPSNSVSTKREL